MPRPFGFKVSQAMRDKIRTTQATRWIDRVVLDEKTGCWNWQGAKNNKGYPMITYYHRSFLLSRLIMHFWSRLPLKGKKCVLHKCDNPACVKPTHLRIGTHKENIQDSIAKGRFRSGIVQRLRTHCQKGHPYDEENTYHHPAGYRECRICKKDYQRRKANEASNK